MNTLHDLMTKACGKYETVIIYQVRLALNDEKSVVKVSDFIDRLNIQLNHYYEARSKGWAKNYRGINIDTKTDLNYIVLENDTYAEAIFFFNKETFNEYNNDYITKFSWMLMQAWNFSNKVKKKPGDNEMHPNPTLYSTPRMYGTTNGKIYIRDTRFSKEYKIIDFLDSEYSYIRNLFTTVTTNIE